MKIQVEGGKLICILLLTLAAAASSQNTVCPFQYLYHFGDGVTDIGNSIHISPKDPNPSRLPPYGTTYPGWPTGRWCDGFVDFDYTSIDFGLPNIVPYLTLPASPKYDGVIFSVARSTVLPREFFKSKGIEIPSYTVPLAGQMAWFEDYLKSVCPNEKDRTARLARSLMLMGDIEGNDVGYALTQGKSIEDVRKNYVPYMVKELIDHSRTLLRLGATRLVIPGNTPLGCVPYILTALWTVEDSEYDELGCLKRVNQLIVEKNAALQKEIEMLKKEFPRAHVFYGPMYEGVLKIINDSSVMGPDGVNKALKGCCGVGGRYNYDNNRFCGDPDVPVCSNPNEYLYWDGIHFTQQASYTMEHMLVQPALVALNCTKSVKLLSDEGASLRITRPRDPQLKIKLKTA